MKIEINDSLLETNAITKIYAYKIDLIVHDEVRFDIQTPEKNFIISEEDSEFDQIDELLGKKLDGYNKDWRSLVINPAFQTNRTLIYSSNKN